MADFPKIFANITKHNPPRYMLYQPGFNPSNSCWLTGRWTYVSKEDYERCADMQNKMYKNIKEESKKQNHRGKKIAIKNLNMAQKIAYNFYSGQTHFDCFKNGRHTVIGVDLAGNSISEISLKWMRKNKYKIIEIITTYGKMRKQLKGYKNIPEDVIHRCKIPIDTVRTTIDDNKQAMVENFNFFIAEGGALFESMAFHSIVQLEESIIRAEWDEKYETPKDMYDDRKKDKKEYIRQRKLLKEKYGKKFDKLYKESKDSHNKCAKANLKNSGNLLYSYVLPKFNEDGTHEPWSEKDVPLPKSKRK